MPVLKLGGLTVIDDEWVIFGCILAACDIFDRDFTDYCVFDEKGIQVYYDIGALKLTLKTSHPESVIFGYCPLSSMEFRYYFPKDMYEPLKLFNYGYTMCVQYLNIESMSLFRT